MTSPPEATRVSRLATLVAAWPIGLGVALVVAGVWGGGASPKAESDGEFVLYPVWYDQAIGAVDASEPPEPQPIDPPEPPAPKESEDPEPREVDVFLSDGSRLSGVLIELTDRDVVIRVGGVRMPVPRTRIDRVVYRPTIMERYEEMRRAVDDDDAEQILLICRWLLSVGRHELALREVEGILSRDPHHPDAMEFRRLVALQVELKERARSRPAAGPPRASPPPPSDPDEFPLLSPDQINLINVMEINLRDPPRFRVRRETMERLFTEFADDPRIPTTREGREALLRRDPGVQLGLIFDLRARHLYPEVQVIDKPSAMRKFRDNVHRTWLIAGCATTKCHGGTEAGRFRLYTRDATTDRTIYTNFLIIERFRTRDDHPLIDYADPARSRLLTYGLPPNTSPLPHPPVPGADGKPGTIGRPVFSSPDDRRFQAAVDWIRSMYRPRPEYPIEYSLPSATSDGAAAAGKPAPEPEPR